MNETQTSSDRLDDAVRRIAQAESAPDVFTTLLDAVPLAVPRAAIFLVRQGRIKGWGCSGYGAEATTLQRQFSGVADEGWLGTLACGTDESVLSRGHAARPEFGQPISQEAIGVALRVRGRTIAVLIAERSADESPWSPQILGVLVTVARLRLEIALIDRRQPAAAEAPAPSASPTPTAVVPVEPAAAEDADSDNDELATARRFARLVATDIRLYNEQDVMQGRQSGDLVARLGDHLHRGKQTFVERHGDLGEPGLQILHDSFVDVLAGGDGSLLPRDAID